MDFKKCVVFLYLSSIFLLSTVQPELRYSICGASEKNYTQNSIYHTNLNTALSSLSSDLNQYGFSNVSMGENPDRVSAVALCRGDVEPDICRSCVEDARRKTLQSCPNQKEAFGGYDKCMIHYSNVSTLGSWSRLPEIYFWNLDNSSSPDQFNQDLRNLLDDLLDRAANGFPLRKFAANNTRGPDFRTIFAAVQCSPDLAAPNCFDCLTSAFEDYAGCEPCKGKKGGRVVRPSCNFRFETERFFNFTLIGSPPPQPVVDDISTVESLQYNFGAIKTATNNFSDSNKLGQGGFGPVYKGKLPNGREIAVKRLSVNSVQGDLEFKNEVLLVAKLQHRNLAWTQWRAGTAMNLVDPILKVKSGAGSSVGEMMRCIHLALLCVQENVGERPTMSTVVLMLSGFSMSLPVPSSPAFFMHSTISPEATLERNEAAAAYLSQNEASITELYPR
nr:putative receptor-like protein kinase At4g00960 isoform X2 [Ipomoea batatas]